MSLDSPPMSASGVALCGAIMTALCCALLGVVVCASSVIWDAAFFNLARPGVPR